MQILRIACTIALDSGIWGNERDPDRIVIPAKEGIQQVVSGLFCRLEFK